MHLVLAKRVLMFLATVFAGWLMDQVPGLGPDLAQKVADAILNHLWLTLTTVAGAAWVFLRRPWESAAPPKPEVRL